MSALSARDATPEELAGTYVLINGIVQGWVVEANPDEGWVDTLCTYTREQVLAYPDSFFVFASMSKVAAGSMEGGVEADEEIDEHEGWKGRGVTTSLRPQMAHDTDLGKMRRENPNLIIVIGAADGEVFFAVDEFGRRLVERKNGLVQIVRR